MMSSHARVNDKKLIVRKRVPGCLSLCSSLCKELNAHIEVGSVPQQLNTNSINTALLNYSAIKKSSVAFDLTSRVESRGPNLKCCSGQQAYWEGNTRYEHNFKATQLSFLP